MNCNNCGYEIEENQKFCTRCGYKIRPFKNNKLSNINNFIENNKIILSGCGAILILILSFLYQVHISSIPFHEKAYLKKEYSLLNQALQMGIAMMDGGNYKNTDEIIQKGIVETLMIKEYANNEITLYDGTKFKINKLRANCGNSSEYGSSNNACAEIITTLPPISKFLGIINVEKENLPYKLYLYKDKVNVERNSKEDKMLFY